MIEELFGTAKVFIGVVHLLPLPGSPRWQGDMKPVLARAQEDALALAEGGADGIIVENLGDSPFSTAPVGAHTVAAMALAVQAVREKIDLPTGINVLRNDAHSALAVAVATGARFIRANVHYGVMVADEGLVQGMAHDTLRYRSALGAEAKVKIFADVLVKHAVPLGNPDIAQVAVQTARRGLADVLLVTGPTTGTPADPEDVAKVKGAVPDVPVLVGSGVEEANARSLLALADGAIVGTSLKVDGVIDNPVDPARVRRLCQRIKALP